MATTPPPDDIKKIVLNRYRTSIERDLRKDMNPDDIIEQKATDLSTTNDWDKPTTKEGVYLAVMEIMEGTSGAPPSGYPTGPVAPHGPHFVGSSHFVVKILHPNPENPRENHLDLHQEPTTGQHFHDKMVFDAEITGGI